MAKSMHARREEVAGTKFGSQDLSTLTASQAGEVRDDVNLEWDLLHEEKRGWLRTRREGQEIVFEVEEVLVPEEAAVRNQGDSLLDCMMDDRLGPCCWPRLWGGLRDADLRRTACASRAVHGKVVSILQETIRKECDDTLRREEDLRTRIEAAGLGSSRGRDLALGLPWLYGQVE